MKRPFYRDPLAAAWQAKHHGMRFTKANDHVIDNFVIAGRISVSDVNPKLEGDRSFLYYVHPESLHVLEPRVGDLCELRGNPEHDHHELTWELIVAYGQDGGWETHDAGYYKGCLESYLNRIVERNGIPFHWPESETA